MDKQYLISLTAAAALGYAAQFAVDGISAHAAKAQAFSANVVMQPGAGAQTTITNFAGSQICPQFDTEQGFSGGDACVAADVQAIAIFRDANQKWMVSATVQKQGTWTASAP